MVESYFEYTISQCDESVIPNVCSLYKTKEKLIDAANRGFNGCDYILGQWRLVLAATDLISQNGYILISELDRDAKKVYLRCERNLQEMKEQNRQHIDIDREWLFNTLVDLNWLFSSKYAHSQGGENGLISLLTSPSLIRIGLRRGLTDVLNETSLYDKERSEQYETAQLKRYAFLAGAHPDAQVRDLFVQGYTPRDFKVLQEQVRETSINKMALFYGLTATAARAEQIRRMR